MATIQDEIWDAIRTSNAAWFGGNPRAVAPLYAEDAVMIAPHLRAKVEGREAMVQSYIDYCREVRTQSFRELEHAVDVRGDVAVATYRFSVRHERAGRTSDEIGQEVLVFALRAGRWEAIWRTQVVVESKLVSEAAPARS